MDSTRVLIAFKEYNNHLVHTFMNGAFLCTTENGSNFLWLFLTPGNLELELLVDKSCGYM